MNKIRIVQVDDQLAQLETVKNLLTGFKNIELVNQFTSATEALDFILANDIDLAILDIEMPDKDGFWLAKKLTTTNTLIVFLTSHPQYTLQAFEACAIHYILKPITKKLLEEVINRSAKIKGLNAEKNTVIQSKQITELIENYLDKTSYPKRIFINNIQKTTILKLDEVLYMTSAGSYTVFKTIHGEKFTSSKLLKTYCDALQNHPDFIRIHRANLINKKYVKSILRDKHKIIIQMSNDEELEASTQKREEIYKLLEK